MVSDDVSLWLFLLGSRQPVQHLERRERHRLYPMKPTLLMLGTSNHLLLGLMTPESQLAHVALHKSSPLKPGHAAVKAAF